MTGDDESSIAELRGATKRFGDVVAARDLNLTIRRGEFLSFLGPSGCGKTTALRMLAGFETPTEGDIYLDGQQVNAIPAHQRPVNMVFQHYALFPHLTVAENISYGLRQRRPRPPAAEVGAAVARALDTVRLPDFGPRRIWEMSGGQQQRVALARAIINEPKLLLLDEPMAALDKKLRHDMQIELQTLQRQLGITFILVTHDQEEALSMSDRICIMRDGQIVQTGSPRDLYDRPKNRYVADFVGKSNFFEGCVESVEGETAKMTCPGGIGFIGYAGDGVRAGQSGIASLRPEQISLTRGNGGVPVTVVNRIFLGEHTEYLVRNPDLGQFLILASRQAEAGEGNFEPGETGSVRWRDGAALILKNE
ncbi:ABC transporter ATP-binding protein [Defluviimonas sp. D31]|uniref:ABC transporter ATP-binding protein n=1 Tax=Defluviimonas sp. D31 TaxID=3083253 RepID=UPI00296EA68F|nr:ABC transporter ATP-binding protein [Defluviimonas sp. D31]MDW4547838.1 ABC transporter ATP-binding protein [Defluviimonas sp. D31]